MTCYACRAYQIVVFFALRRGPPQVGGVLKADQSVPKYKGWYLKWN